MSVPRVIYGLAKKRAELVAELDHPDGRHEFCRNGIATIDAALVLWPGTEAPLLKRRHKAKPTLIPQLTRKIVIALRNADQPVTTAQIVTAVSAELSAQDRLALTKLVGWRLRDMRKDGRVSVVKRADHRNNWFVIDY